VILFYVRPKHYVASPLLIELRPELVDVRLQRENQLKVTLSLALFLVLNEALKVIFLSYQVALLRWHDLSGATS
jgi:TRAP-type mannitol/chloroaromatic compound transport system permease small subunit